MEDTRIPTSEAFNSETSSASQTALAEETPTFTEQSPTLELVGLHRYFGSLKAVRDVSFKAYPGQVLGFIGPNGAGKTTAMRIISTLDMPTAGDAFVCGYSVVDDPDKVRSVLGFMPDNFGKYVNMNVVEYLDFYARAYGLRGQRRRDAVDRVMSFTELDRLAEKPIVSLSKGQSQRLGLGRTLIHDPQVLVLDEPAAGLDPRARVELRELVHLLATEMDKTVLISSHILTELGEICDSAAIIEAGQILVSGTMEAIRAKQRARRGIHGCCAVRVRLLDKRDQLPRWLLEQPHVVTAEKTNNHVHFEYDGPETSLPDLLKQMIEQGFPVVEFTSKEDTLEDAFMAITEGLMQ